MNTFQNKVDSIAESVASAQKQLEMYIRLLALFTDVELPREVSIWAHEYDEYTVVEFRPGYGESAEKNMQPFTHRLVRHLGVKLLKRKNYDGASLECVGRFERDGRQYKVSVSGVVPATCHVVEKRIPLTEDEIQAAREKALSEVPEFRVEREIICTEETDESVDESEDEDAA